MPIEYLQVIAVPVSDQSRAREFYVDVLRWDLLSDQSYPLGDGKKARWLEVRPPNGQTAVTLEEDVARAGTMRGLTLRASDLTGTVSELTARGVPMAHEVRHTPLAMYTSFWDPDGNTWTIQEIVNRDRG